MAASYPWILKDGVWRRTLGSMESFYNTLATPEGYPVHWMIGCSVSISYLGSNPNINIENSICQAWKTIRHDFPNIAAVVDPGAEEMLVRVDMDEKEEDAWLGRSFQVHGDGITTDELFASFKSQFCITLHFLRESNELVIQAPHSLIDGRGTLYLYHALFTALSKQSQSSEDHVSGSNGDLRTKPESLNLSKPYDEWLNISAQPTQKNIQDAGSIIQRIIGQEKPIVLPAIDFKRTPNKAVHRELSLGADQTSSIIQAAKKEGVSITSAWHAALAIATQKIQLEFGEEPGTSYTQFTTIDLRRHFPTTFTPARHSIASLQSALPFATDLSKDTNFSSLSQSLNSQYKSPFLFASNDFNYLGPYMSISKQILQSGAVPPSSTPYLSSMGVVDDFLARCYGDWELGGFWVSSTMLTGDIQMYLWTWKGKMVFSACYNDAFYNSEYADMVLEKTKFELLSGLGVA